MKKNRTVLLQWDYKVQLPEPFRANQNLKHIIKGIVQMLLEHGREWDINYLDGKPVVTQIITTCYQMKVTRTSVKLDWKEHVAKHLSCHISSGQDVNAVVRGKIHF